MQGRLLIIASIAVILLIGASCEAPPRVTSVNSSNTPVDNVQRAVESPIENQGEAAADSASNTQAPLPSVDLYAVTQVVDGDTFKVVIGDKTETLRMIGIDTPETVDPRKPVQCFGVEASNKAKTLLTGKKVRLEADPTQGERDKYSRLLRYAYLEDGTFFNKIMISDGYAHEYTYDVPYKYQAEFNQAEADARSNKRGLWADDACVEPVVTPTPTTPTPSPVPVVPPAPAASNCDPNYSGCVPIASDVDCAGGSGNGPAYVRGPVTVIGIDIYGLDRDGDGTACD
ncbi:MAG: thermonuclease family protein [Patescibacteria group bacterium]